MNKNKGTALTFDDILLDINHSTVLSRDNVDLSTFIIRDPELKIEIPIISTPMRTITNSKMASKMTELGGVGIIHRFQSVEDQYKEIVRINGVVGAAIGVKDGWIKRTEYCIDAGANFIVLDIAHGDHIHQKNVLAKYKSKFDIPIVAANIATYKAARRVCDWGADAVRCGIGGGSLCATRIMTGFGVPAITCIEECSKGIEDSGRNIPLLYDGGIRNSGDIAKALAVGADAVIIGSLFAGCIEVPTNPTYNPATNQWECVYAGSASTEVKGEFRYIEGAKKIFPPRGSVTAIVETLKQGLRSAFSYGGAHNLEEFQQQCQYYQVTTNGLIESYPHGLKTP